MATAAFGSAAILALGAAAAAYAALKQSPPPPQGPTTPVAQTPTVSSTTSSATTSSGIPSTEGEGLPEGTGKPPKIPHSEPTPNESEEFGGEGFWEEAEEEEEEENGKGEGQGKGGEGKQGKEGANGKEGGKKEEEGEPESAACKGGGRAAAMSVSATQTSNATTSSTQTSSQTSSSQSASVSTAEEEEAAAAEEVEREAEEAEEEEEEEGNCKQEAKRAPILLDTDAASIYDPNGYPEAGFGDPSLAIDGESTTSWTAPLAPEIGPLVQSGLRLNLKARRRIAKVTLITSTPGMSVQVYGTTQRKPPSSLNSVAWVKLSHLHVAGKRKSSVELWRSRQKIRQLLIWVAKAPEGAESAAIGEAELYEPK